MKLTNQMILNATLERRNGFILSARGTASHILRECIYNDSTIKDAFYSDAKVWFPVDAVTIRNLARNKIAAYDPPNVYPK